MTKKKGRQKFWKIYENCFGENAESFLETPLKTLLRPHIDVGYGFGPTEKYLEKVDGETQKVFQKRP